ncbi:MAG TPA: hypothetical protein VGG61_06180 [Gemmataceae bacterium]
MPRTHNDGRPVSPEKFQQTLDEVIAQFGALSLYPQPIRGLWIHKETRYEDELIPIIIDVDDTPENQHFFLGLKAILLERFEQIAVYIVSYPVDIL